jgi:hypothetical protein
MELSVVQVDNVTVGERHIQGMVMPKFCIG